ncbi:hypothetical protein FVER14953_20745 [Fusarium verticillioides]|nr:hypothetical protein FVER14953_20745 [Fusarium verticillioides]
MVFDSWLSAEEELTKQINLNEELKMQLETTKAEAAKAKAPSFP